MLTVHAAEVLWTGPGHELVRGGAVVVEGARIAFAGPYEKVVAECPRARVRRWPGLLTPGLVNREAGWLLEAVYHPDPREAEALGTEPVMNAALAAARPGESARRGVQRMLAHGTTAVVGPFEVPEVRAAVERAGLVVAAAAPSGVRSATPLDPLAGEACDGAFTAAPVPGGRADLAVFDVRTDGDPLAALAEAGAGTCVATVLGGRLVHRRR
ncbi:hypothetical protein ACH429_22910 [Streptomyces pathocidini]|uniref:Uncharacterized protein n=1 Tax=Streptomyces pathocidini TaxID=1650571 RepID=A0ABW7UZS7_9ACTN|nr:hypothetical protein [Streptomyces pathocidini]